MKVKVISLLQPWASLVVLGQKKIETRSWNTKHRGEIYIHASQKFDDDMKELASSFPFKDVLIKAGLLKMTNYGIYTECEFNIPKGAIIGKANLIDTIPFNSVRGMIDNNMGCYIGGNKVEFTEQELAFGDFGYDRYGWLLSNPVAFDKPIPAKGKLSIWEWDL